MMNKITCGDCTYCAAEYDFQRQRCELVCVVEPDRPRRIHSTDEACGLFKTEHAVLTCRKCGETYPSDNGGKLTITTAYGRDEVSICPKCTKKLWKKYGVS